MFGLLILSILFLFLLPLYPAIKEWRVKSDAKPLMVRNSFDTDIMHFARGFKEFVDKNFGNLLTDNHGQFMEGKLNNRDLYQLVSLEGRPLLTKYEITDHSTSKIYISRGDLELPEGIFFEREIYGAANITTGKDCYFRAIFSEKDAHIGANSRVLRWIHSEGKIIAEPRVELYGRASARESILLTPNSYFERLGAPVIYFGQPDHDARESDSLQKEQVAIDIEDFARVVDKSCGRWLVDGDMETPENWLFAGNLVVRGELRVGKNSRIQGSIKSHKHLVLGDGTNVEGSTVSSKNVYINKGCSVKGPVIAEVSVFVNSNSIVGSPTIPTTITSPKIFISNNVVVHGTVWATQAGVLIENFQVKL